MLIKLQIVASAAVRIDMVGIVGMLKGRITRVRGQIISWYKGERVPPLPHDTFSSLVFIPRSDRCEKSASAEAATALYEFWHKHWQWTIGIIVAVALGLLRLLR